MIKFIWIRDSDNVEHFVNVHHIVRVCKVPANGKFSAYAYVILHEASREIVLSNDKYDTFNDVVAKIQGPLA